jgi:hypothetical protein
MNGEAAFFYDGAKSNQKDGFVRSIPAPSGTEGLFTKPSFLEAFTSLTAPPFPGHPYSSR